jgi:hypothetical protein
MRRHGGGPGAALPPDPPTGSPPRSRASRPIPRAPRLAALGAEPVIEAPGPLAHRIDGDIARWAKVIKAAHVTLE